MIRDNLNQKKGPSKKNSWERRRTQLNFFIIPDALMTRQGKNGWNGGETAQNKRFKKKATRKGTSLQDRGFGAKKLGEKGVGTEITNRFKPRERRKLSKVCPGVSTPEAQNKGSPRKGGDKGQGEKSQNERFWVPKKRTDPGRGSQRRRPRLGGGNQKKSGGGSHGGEHRIRKPGNSSKSALNGEHV